MFLKFLKISIILMGLMGVGISSAQAQEIEVFKQKMAQAAELTKTDLNAALQMYLEIRVEFGGPEIDYSLGRTYQRLGQCENAKHYYSAVLTYNLAESHPIYQRSVKAFDEISTCDSWQQYTFECEVPVGGYVMLDDNRVSACPTQTFVASPGEHTFTLVDKTGKTTEVKRSAKNGASESVTLKFEVEHVTVERVEVKETTYILKDRFHPALYWGLMVGGVALVAGGGFFLGMANSAYAEEQKYADHFAIYGDEDSKNKSSKAHDQYKLGNLLMYSFVGAGGAIALTGVVLAIVNAVMEPERVEVQDGLSAYMHATSDGVSFGLGMRF